MAKTASSMKVVGRNVEYKIEGDKLTIEIDLSADREPSGSGKTLIIATTQGNKAIGDGHLGLNYYVYAEKKKKKAGK